jgi:hypothetical protein
MSERCESEQMKEKDMPKFVRGATQELIRHGVITLPPRAPAVRPDPAELMAISVKPNRGIVSVAWQIDGSMLVFDAQVVVDGDANLDVVIPRGLASFAELQIEEGDEAITGMAHLVDGQWVMKSLTGIQQIPA